ncbi:MAG: M56 family metallopeptidase [Eubacteriales bacterium]|nr:M56 family metallopeptidase [Eubacteriales bacterium]
MMLYICMSVAGSIPVIACLILWAVQKHSYHYVFGKRLLLTGMFFYLVPFQAVKYLLPERMISALSVPDKMGVEQTLNEFVAVHTIAPAGESVWIPVWVTVLLMIWLWCILIFAVYQIVRYRIDIRKLLSKSTRVSAEIEGRTVELYLHKKIRSPYTVGFLKPVIIVPEDSLGHPCFSMIYRHEEQHWKNHDSFMKLICIVIICIHWMNPIAILLLVLYNVTAEYICDAKAGEGCSTEEKKKYLKLLIDLSTIEEPLSLVWRNHLTNGENLIKRRIDCMMEKKKIGLVRRGIAVAASVITVMASASTIFAYEPFSSADENISEFLNEEDIISFSSDYNIDAIDFSNSDYIFAYEDGTQVAVDNDASPYALCNHTMKSG